MKTSNAVGLCIALLTGTALAQTVTVTVQADSGRKAISPWIYGRNNSVSHDSTSPTSAAILTIYKDAGIRMLRENNGNNSTKYNWRLKLTSAPDWYNNVYSDNWDYVARTIQQQLPGTQGLFAFQLLGYAAKTNAANFNDWAYNSSAGWGGVNQNLAGGGTVAPSGAVPPGGTNGAQLCWTSQNGNINNYLTPWPADSTAGIAPHWFGAGGTGLDSTRFRYWNMDNEPEIWASPCGTHDDVYPVSITAEQYVQKYAAVAKAVRRVYPSARLVGPSSSTEWGWYNWNNTGITYKTKTVGFPEYFIWRLKEIQDSSGVRMLDVYDVHDYLNLNSSTEPAADLLQQHRVWFDTNYVFPGANGVKNIGGTWNSTVTREYFFTRVQRLLTQYFGAGNGIGYGITESGDDAMKNDANLAAVWMASHLGTFADNGFEVFTPWFWYNGYYETMRLFSKKGHENRVLSRSSLDSVVSAYTSLNKTADSMTVILVNRDLSASHTTSVSLKNFTVSGNGTTLQLANLSGETFVSEASNGSKSGTVTVTSNAFSLALPAKSVTAVLLRGTGTPFSSSSASSSSVATSSSSAASSSSVITSSSSIPVQAMTPLQPAAEITLQRASDGFTLLGTLGSEQVELLSVQGSLLTRFQATPLQTDWHGLSGLKPGLYVVRLLGGVSAKTWLLTKLVS